MCEITKEMNSDKMWIWFHETMRRTIFSIDMNRDIYDDKSLSKRNGDAYNLRNGYNKEDIVQNMTSGDLTQRQICGKWIADNSAIDNK